MPYTSEHLKGGVKNDYNVIHKQKANCFLYILILNTTIHTQYITTLCTPQTRTMKNKNSKSYFPKMVHQSKYTHRI